MQQVNLYLPELRPKREWLTAVSLVFLLLGFCGLMTLSVLANYHQLYQYKQDVVMLETQKDISSARLADIKQRLPSDVVVTLDEKVANLRDRITIKTKLKEAIGAKILGDRSGYSSRFNAMAKNISSDVAISRFKFSAGVDHIELSGESRKADQVAAMVSVLKSSPSFSGTSFGRLTMQDQTSKRGRIEFSFGFSSLFDHEKSLSGAHR